MMRFLFTTVIIELIGLALGRGLVLDISELRTEEMLTNIDEMKVAIMGMAEYVQEINKNVNQVRVDLEGQGPKPEQRQSSKYGGYKFTKGSRGLTVDEILKREELAEKIERLFRNDNKTKVEAVKEEMATVVETNMIKMLSAILLTGPIQAQEKTPQILRLMRNILNKELDMKPIVDRLPFLIRNSETNQFILLLKALRDHERSSNRRQLGGLEDLGKVVDAAGKLDIKQVSGFLKEIPELFESIESVVDGVDEYF